MSQWGARGLAEHGFDADQILHYFYRGTQVSQLADPGGVRVGLLQEQSTITVSGNGRFDLYDRSGIRRASGTKDAAWTVQPVASNRLAVFDARGRRSFTTAVPVTVRYEDSRTLLNLPQTGYSYRRGRIDLDINPTTGKMRAILLIGFEQYLYGIAEMPSSWATEALKAQAVAARSYALEKIERLGENRPVCNCGVYATVADQVYVGAQQETTSWTSAVDRTRSRFVTYRGTPIKAFYSASDGGFTENNENVFGGDPIPYLRGVCDPGDYASGFDPHSNWTVNITDAEIGRRMKQAGYSIGTATGIEVKRPIGISGRIRPPTDQSHGGVVVTGSDGSARLSADRFRSVLGLPSTLVLHNLAGPIRLRYDSLTCAPGLPRSDEYAWRNPDGSSNGTAQDFTVGRLFQNASKAKVYWVKGPILARYDDLRWHGLDLGLPTSDEYSVSGGRRGDFEHGFIRWDSRTNSTSAHVQR